MYINDCVPVFKLQLGECLVAQNARIVDCDVNTAPFGKRALNHVLHGIKISNRRAVRNGGTAIIHDFLRNEFRGRGRSTAAVDRSAQVINHDLRASPAKF